MQTHRNSWAAADQLALEIVSHVEVFQRTQAICNPYRSADEWDYSATSSCFPASENDCDKF